MQSGGRGTRACGDVVIAVARASGDSTLGRPRRRSQRAIHGVDVLLARRLRAHGARLRRCSAARAATAGNGWKRDRCVPCRDPGLDTLAGGEGRELLARSALARADDSTALRARSRRRDGSGRNPYAADPCHAARPRARPADLREAARGERPSAELLPTAADWLHLRAAASPTTTRSSTKSSVTCATRARASDRLDGCAGA